MPERKITPIYVEVAHLLINLFKQAEVLGTTIQPIPPTIVFWERMGTVLHDQTQAMEFVHMPISRLELRTNVRNVDLGAQNVISQELLEMFRNVHTVLDTICSERANQMILVIAIVRL
jgi:hypothetical protein